MVEQENLILTPPGAQDWLGAIKTLLTGAKLRATKAAVAIDANVTEAALEAQEATYTGYAAVVLTWSAIGRNGNGQWTFASQRVRLQATGPDPIATTNTLYNLWVSSAVGPPGVLEVACTLQTPMPIIDAEGYLDCTVYIALGPLGPVGWIDTER